MNSFIIAILVTFCLMAGCTETFKKNTPPLPMELSSLYHKDTIRTDSSTQVNTSRFFIVKDPSISNLPDSVFLSYLDTMNRQGIDQANYLFYKESYKTNAEHLLTFPKDLDRYSQQNDLFLVYMWTRKQKKWLIFKYKDGQVVSPDSNNIKVTDVQ